MNISKQAVAILCLLWFTAGTIFSQDYESIDGALIYDHDPSTKLGDDVFGTLISDLEHDFPGRNSQWWARMHGVSQRSDRGIQYEYE